MLKIKVRCISKNTGEVFYEYDTIKIAELDRVRNVMDCARSAFFKRLMSDLREDCTFEFTVLHCCEELSLDFQSDKVDDYNKTPVVF